MYIYLKISILGGKTQESKNTKEYSYLGKSCLSQTHNDSQMSEWPVRIIESIHIENPKESTEKLIKFYFYFIRIFLFIYLLFFLAFALFFFNFILFLNFT